MKPLLPTLALAFLLCTSLAQTTQPQSNVALPDPLPSGATLRFGSARFRHGIPIPTLAISPNGKLAVAVNGGNMLAAVRTFDLATGLPLHAVEGPDAMQIAAQLFSPDSRFLITKQDFSICVRESATGSLLRTSTLPRVNSWSNTDWLTVSPDGKIIAVASEGKTAHLIDFETGRFIHDLKVKEAAVIFAGAFSPDSKIFASGGHPAENDNYFVQLWDVESGKELRRLMHGRGSGGIYRLAFSPDGKTLATGAGDARLRLFNVETAAEVKAFPKDGERRPGGVSFSPDGKSVAIAAASIRVYDTASGEERLKIDRRAIGLQFTDDGKTLTGAVMGSICRWDASSGKLLTPEGGNTVVEQIIPSADGSRLLTRGQDGDAHLWDAATAQYLRYLPATWQRGIAMSPDAQFVAWSFEDPAIRFPDPQRSNVIHYGSRIRLYDVAASAFVERFAPFQGEAHELAFTNAGKQLVTLDHRDAKVRIWNVETGKELRSFQALREDELAQSNAAWSSIVSPNGKAIAISYALQRGRGRSGAEMQGRLGLIDEACPIRVWDLETGKELRQFDQSARNVRNMAISPDSKWLAAAGSAFDTAITGQSLIWNIRTGKTASTLPFPSTAVAFSSDGRTFALTSPDGVVRLLETATWTLRNEYKGPKTRPAAAAFAPNRPLLYTGNVDTTVFAWDFRIPPAAAPGSLDTAWNELATPTAARALVAQSQCLAAPAETLKLFAAKISPIKPIDPKQIEQAIANLDDAQFDAREAASKILTDLGPIAFPALEKALTTATSPEVKERITILLGQDTQFTPEQLRHLRAVEILKNLSTPDSKKLLTQWSTGQPGAPLTTAASQ